MSFMWSSQDEKFFREVGIRTRDEWPAAVGDGQQARLADYSSDADRAAAHWKCRYHRATRDVQSLRKQCIVAWSLWLVTVLAYVVTRG